MAIFRLDAAAFARIDCRFIESVSWSIVNDGAEVFDCLVHVYNNGILFYETLQEMESRRLIDLPPLTPSYAPFSLLIVTNFSTHKPMRIKAVLRSQGTVIATLTEKDFDRLD
ncbi:hypothetical protein [Paenibacillus sp. BC26]|uniref:hypothetical protein n=1 Tax=Paenibacillus sp. BC26 TaxID=1881032 RepID=UPI0008E870BE|nr:hypothetical protein [Paenibacillus sp. BC26]SFT29335.1 hypothetical protein SAMN05428962_0066 [Paenibacillus sp. BC26]